MGISRRVVLSGGAALLAAAAVTGFELVDHAVLPGKGRLDEALGRCDATPPAPLTASAPLPSIGSFPSRLRGRPVSYALAYPPGSRRGAKLPVCLALHGFGSDALSAVNTGNYPRLMADLVTAGGRPFVLAAADGGGGYWHPHAASGDDPLGMLFEEFLPMLGAEYGLESERVAVAGWSMGGYGALLSALTYRDRVSYVVASSPAIFRDYDDAEHVNPGAYDSRAEWDRYDITARASELSGVPMRIDIGSADPFAPTVHRLRDHLPDPAVVTFSTGCHDGRYWDAVAPSQVASIAKALS
ncbi:alpha/beta hydrolase [Dactylosporangium sp. NPDC051541]|uniref:alpha/beta hydrolase n=1 Tax=Dactylosporangium sp. NPDC051541 TaxID=3363977 RepID=UPI00379E5915